MKKSLPEKAYKIEEPSEVNVDKYVQAITQLRKELADLQDFFAISLMPWPM